MHKYLTIISVCFTLFFIQYSFAATELLPDDIHWETNTTDASFASDKAVKGGTFRTYMLGFPLTLRTAGPDANGVFRNYSSNFSMSLVGIHPNTRNPIPILATHWAVASDGKTIYFKLDPTAKWSDGEKITADDYT